MNTKIFKLITAIIAVLFTTVTATAQEAKTMYVMKNGAIAYESAVSEIDSIIFYKPANTTDPTTEEELFIVDISEETDWDLMMVAIDGSSIFLSIDETTEIPTYLFFKPDINSDEGFSIFFNEKGLPETMIIDDYIIYFSNFRGNLFDFALIHPNNSIEYFYDIDTEIDWDNLFELSMLRLFNFKKIVKHISNAVSGVSCAVSSVAAFTSGGVATPVAVAACASFVANVLNDYIIPIAPSGLAEGLQVVAWTATTIGCALPDPNPINKASCVVGYASMAIDAVYYGLEVVDQFSEAIGQASNQINASNPTPVITIAAQPKMSNSVLADFINGSLNVSASVTQGATLSYQWYSNTMSSSTGGTLISGATSANFQIPTNLTLGMYYYFCEISAIGGATTRRTNAATVHVTNPIITINTHPTSFNATVGSITGNLSVSASITSGAAFNYQWYSNTTNSNSGGTIISGATSANYAIPATLAEGTYYYFCELRTTSGSVFIRSNVATVNVQYAGTPLITINSQPAQITTVTYGNITGSLSVNASVTFSATLSYQWYSNTTNSNIGGTEIPDATSASFTIPTTLTIGAYYYFCEVRATRGATSLRSNVAMVSVVPGPYYDEGIVINGVKWATRNIDAPGTFADNPESSGMFYQWNRKIGWSTTDPMVDSNGGTEWDATLPEGTEWKTANCPCPPGWRVPTVGELESLDASGNQWTTQNGIYGRVFGSGNNTIFLPAVGIGRYGSGTLAVGSFGSYGSYWSSTQLVVGSSTTWHLYFGSDFVTMGNSNSDMGLCVRCVADN